MALRWVFYSFSRLARGGLRPKAGPIGSGARAFMPRVIITASSFCKNEILCAEVVAAMPDVEIVFHPLNSKSNPLEVATALNGFDGAKELRVKLMETENASQVEKIITKFVETQLF